LSGAYFYFNQCSFLTFRWFLLQEILKVYSSEIRETIGFLADFSFLLEFCLDLSLFQNGGGANPAGSGSHISSLNSCLYLSAYRLAKFKFGIPAKVISSLNYLTPQMHYFISTFTLSSYFVPQSEFAQHSFYFSDRCLGNGNFNWFWKSLNSAEI